MEQSSEKYFSISRSTVYLVIAIVIATYYKIWLSDHCCPVKKNSKRRKETIRNIWNNFYRHFVPWFFVLFIFLIPARGVYELVKRKVRPVTVLGLSVLAAIISNTTIVTLVQITPYSEIGRAMQHGYPVLIIFIIAGFMLLSELVGGWRRKKDTTSQR